MKDLVTKRILATISLVVLLLLIVIASNHFGTHAVVIQGKLNPGYGVENIVTALAGQWKGSDVKVNPDGEKTDHGTYRGFTVDDADQKPQELRMYYDDDLKVGTDVSGELRQLKKWSITEEGHRPTLKIFDWYPDADLYLYKTYEIEQLTKDTLVIREISDSGVAGEPKTLRRTKTAQAEASVDFHAVGFVKDDECESVLGGNSSKYQLPLTCDLELKKGEEPVQITFSEFGDVTIKRDGKDIFSINSFITVDTAVHGNWNVMEGPGPTTSEITDYDRGPFLINDAVLVVDINYDGYKDIAVRGLSGAYNFFYNFHAYDPKTKSFSEKPILEDIVNPEIDAKKRTVTSFDKGRGLADYYTKEVYEFIAGKYVLTVRITSDLLTDSDVVPAEYLFTIEELKNGTWVETKKEKIYEEDQVYVPQNDTYMTHDARMYVLKADEKGNLDLSPIIKDYDAWFRLPLIPDHINIGYKKVYAFVSDGSDDLSYYIVLCGTESCEGVNSYNLAVFTGEYGEKILHSTNAEPVHLVNGIQGFFTEANCMGACHNPEISWRGIGKDAQMTYSIEVEGVEKDELIKIVNQTLVDKDIAEACSTDSRWIGDCNNAYDNKKFSEDCIASLLETGFTEENSEYRALFESCMLERKQTKFRLMTGE